MKLRDLRNRFFLPSRQHQRIPQVTEMAVPADDLPTQGWSLI